MTYLSANLCYFLIQPNFFIRFYTFRQILLSILSFLPANMVFTVNESWNSDQDYINAFSKKYCLENNIEFVNITDITQQGLAEPNLVAPDGLHPSELAYSKFVERILPLAKNKLGI